jgi:phospholipid/cholesterol/gamma-HCH transport system permease protein
VNRGSRSVLARVADAVEFGGGALVLFAEATVGVFTPQHLVRSLHRLMDQLYLQLVKSMGVVTIVGVFIGMILAIQSGEELRQYGAEERLAFIVAGSMAREMGPFVTAVILAATVGGAIAAELGTMRVSEEIDALELMNIDPIRYLVVPRVVALTISSVLLTVLVNIVGGAGAPLVSQAQFGIPYSDFFESAREALAGPWLLGGLSKDLYSGLTKSLVYGMMIGALSCTAGLNASGGALGVGKAVRRAVVASVVLTLVIGYIITWFFWVLLP